ncbi:hypothetical protein D9611_012032 [Ephemerocybe angulata]|uniref:F-box domain-containing protein n=1 Tax=Ephemerocybe angulata TaxID=980116 RepID=A0A8H5ASW9_9AGAR|nr:hypothetical protein D9611_012032 [Tulosesus angulatus]
MPTERPSAARMRRTVTAGRRKGFATPLREAVLGNEDLLALIFSEFRAEDDRRNIYAHTLVQSALTCKAFTNPALDVLWERLSSPLALFALLPPIHISNREMRVARPFVPGDWDRFVFYAKRVRKLSVNGIPSAHRAFDLTTISPCVFSAINKAPYRPRPLMTSLRSLHFECRSLVTQQRPDIDNLFLWLSPPLLNLSLRLSPERVPKEDLTSVILTAVAAQSPDIRKIRWFSSVRMSSLDPCKSLRSLTTLILHPLLQPEWSSKSDNDYDHIVVLDHLSRCSSLEALTIITERYAWVEEEPTPLKWERILRVIKHSTSSNHIKLIRFPNLQYFNTCGDPVWLMQALAQLAPTLASLHTLNLQMHFGHNVRARFNGLNFWKALSKRLAVCSDLRHLLILDPHHHVKKLVCEESLSVDLADLLEPLSRSRTSLAEVTIGAPLGIGWGGKGIYNLAAYFPELQSLCLPEGTTMSRSEMLDRR